MNYIEVVHWEEFQHYKHRNPPWVKLHNQLLENYDYTCLPDCSKSHLLGIWMLASRTENKIPANLTWIASKIGATDPVNIDILVEASFLRYKSASGVLADCPTTTPKSVPLVEKSRVEKSREETELLSIDKSINGDVKSVFNYWQGVMGKELFKLTPKRRDKIKTRLKSFSIQQLCLAIDGCKSSDYHQGLNDRQTEYNDLELIFRTDDNVEKFMEMAKKSHSQSADLESWISEGVTQ